MTPLQHIQTTRQSLEQTDKAMDAEIFKQMWIEGDLTPPANDYEQEYKEYINEQRISN